MGAPDLIEPRHVGCQRRLGPVPRPVLVLLGVQVLLAAGRARLALVELEARVHAPGRRHRNGQGGADPERRRAPLLQVGGEDVLGVHEEVRPEVVRGLRGGQLGQVLLQLGLGVPPGVVGVGLAEADLGEHVHHRRGAERLGEEHHLGVLGLDGVKQPLPEAHRLGVRVVHAEYADTVADPVIEDALAGSVERRRLGAVEVERDDVLVDLGWVLRVGDGAVGTDAEPLGVLLDPRAGARRVRLQQLGDGGIGGRGQPGGGIALAAEAGDRLDQRAPTGGRQPGRLALQQQGALLQLEVDVAAGVELGGRAAQPGGQLVGPRLDREGPHAHAWQGDLGLPPVQAVVDLGHADALILALTGADDPDRRGDLHGVAVAEDGRLDGHALTGDRAGRPLPAVNLRSDPLDDDAPDHTCTLPPGVGANARSGDFAANERLYSRRIMKPLQRFTVLPTVPKPLEPLSVLARNLRWTWHPPVQELFAAMDPAGWEASGHNPLRMLNEADAAVLERAAADPAFLAAQAAAADDLATYLREPRWYQTLSGAPSRIAYFSPEFGVSEVLPQYSGGLGVLAGDHLKAASDLGVPLVGVGLFYRSGYFRQALTADGRQVESYPAFNPQELPLELVTDDEGGPLRINVRLPDGAPLFAQLWRADVGRVPLFLLDSDVDGNAPVERAVTDRLYGGGGEHRLRQEILLGIGGVRALDALGLRAEVFHTNEGHAGYLGLERIRRLIQDEGLDAASAIEATRAGTIFTTHTPVE